MDNEEAVEGYITAVCHPAGLTLVEIEVGEAATNVGAEFTASSIEAAGGYVGVVLDFGPPFDGQKIDPGSSQPIATYTYQCDTPPAAGESPLCYDLTFCDGTLGSPTLDNVLVSAGLSINPILMDGQFCCYPVTGACCTGAGSGTPLECLETDRDDCAARGGVYAGGGSLCEEDLEAQCIPLAVTMESMSAVQTSKGVQLRWTTASEVDTVGFRLLRETADARKSAPVIVADMIPSAGNSLGGASYGFLDNNKQAWRATRYYVEDIDIYGKVTRHGPIEVIRGSKKPGAAEARANP